MGNIEEKFASLLVQILSHQNVPGSMDVARRLVRDNRKSINELIREAKEIGWHTRDADKGTYYEIGWDHAPDEENGEECKLQQVFHMLKQHLTVGVAITVL
jgi:hypothetical protein